MLGFRDNATLAFTKLRSRRVRLIVTLIVSGLLFTVLVAGSLVTRGVFASLSTFTKDGFSSRFLVAVYPNPDTSVNSDPAIVKRAQAIQNDLIARKTAAAKRLGVPYDPASEPKITNEGAPEGPKQPGINTSIPAVQQAVHELAPTPKLTDAIKPVAKPYGLKAVYTGNRLGGYDGNDFQLVPVVAGKEVTPSQSFDPSQDPIATFAFVGFGLVGLLLG